MNYAARTRLGFLSFNIGWWACALGVSHGHSWVGPALLPVLTLVQLYYSPNAKGELLFLIILGVLGFAVDSSLIRLHLFTLIPEETLAPAWLISMWIFLGFNWESLWMMRRKLPLILLCGALCGPLTYYFAEGMNILKYTRPLWMTLPLHALVWSVLTPAIFWIRDLTVGISGPWVAQPPAVVQNQAPEESAMPAAAAAIEPPAMKIPQDKY